MTSIVDRGQIDGARSPAASYFLWPEARRSTRFGQGAVKGRSDPGGIRRPGRTRARHVVERRPRGGSSSASRGTWRRKVARPLVELLRRAHLRTGRLRTASVAERHRLDLIVGDVERGRAERCVEARATRASRRGASRRGSRAARRRGSWRLADDRAAHRDALALAAGELRRRADRGAPRGRAARRRRRRACRSRPSASAAAEPEAEVVANGQVRIERVALEDHRDVAVARREAGDVAVADRDRSRAASSRPAMSAEQRRLAAARSARRAPGTRRRGSRGEMSSTATTSPA